MKTIKMKNETRTKKGKIMNKIKQTKEKQK